MYRKGSLLVAFLSLIVFVSANSWTSRTNSDCPSIKVTHEVNENSSGESTIRLKVTGAEKPLRYVFFLESGELLNKDFYSAKFKTDKKGKIYYAVKDGKGCMVQANVLIE